MTAWNIFRVVVWVVGIPIIVLLVKSILHRLREIDKRIEEVRAEEAEIARNPYAAYARMLEVEQLLEEARGKKRRKWGGNEEIRK